MNIKFVLKQYVKMFVQSVVLPIVYSLHKYKPIEENLVIFADAHNSSMPYSMEYLYNELSKQQYTIETHIQNYATASFFHTVKGMLFFMKRYARAKYVIVCDNYLPVASCNKRSQTKVIQLWHACGAYKKFGRDAMDDVPYYYRGNVLKNIDLVTVSSEYCIPFFSSAMHLPKETFWPIGVSRTDQFFKEEYKERCKEKFYTQYPQAGNKKIILWAPTFRGNAGMPILVGDKEIEKLSRELGDEYYVITKLHPHMEEKFKLSNCSMPTEELLPVADMLITDYSSIIFEFTILHKPIVFFVPDYVEYTSKRGFYLDSSELPGERVMTSSELKNVVIDQFTNYNLEKANKFYDKYMNACDGSATDRIISLLVKEEL
ncbi:MAG: CDP-glycerol glycerophosphotransferase family protein [bacterium]|nr:CDP-glycerol glycerophosphotransferase family protein [bacterium]